VIEDDLNDAALIEQELRRASIPFVLRRADSEASVRAALRDFAPSIVLTDHSLPQFDARDALRLVREWNADTPVLVVTGSLNEETAVEYIKAGAVDYIVKQRLERLPSAVQRALNLSRARAEQLRAESEVRRSEARHTAILDAALDAHITMDTAGTITSWNPQAAAVFGWPAAEVLGRRLADVIIPPASREAHQRGIERFLATGEGPILNRRMELTALGHDGSEFPVELAITPIHVGDDWFFSAFVEDITERKRIDQGIRDREERFRQLAENITEVFFVMDAQFQETLYISPAYEGIWGVSCQSLYENPQSFIDGVSPDDRAHVMAYIARNQQGEDAGEVEFRVIRPNGDVRWILGHSVPIRNESGAVYRISGVALDITRRKRAERALQESELYHRTILENIGDAVFIADSEGRFLDANPQACELTGYSREELLRLQVGDTYPPEERGAAARRVADVVGGAPVVVERALLRKDGAILTVETNARMLPDGRMLGTVHDITERTRLETQLHQARQMEADTAGRLRDLLEHANDGISVIGSTGVIQEANRRLGEILGRPVSELIGRHIGDFPSAQSAAATVPEFGAVVARGAGTVLGVEMQRPDGKVAIVDFSLSSVDIAGERVVLSIGRDVTEQRTLETQYRQAQKMEAIGRLAGGVAHDFNNVLTAVFGYVDLLREELVDNASAQQDLAQIHKAAERAAGLTRQLLAFSRQQVLEPVVLELNGLVEDFEKMLGRVIGEDVELRLALGKEVGNVRADPGQLHQVIMNLVVNARDAMPTGGTLILETTNAHLTEQYAEMHQPVVPGPYVMLAVSDTGTGMSPEVKARIFEPFFTTKERDKGTGLGLSTVYGIVKQSGGYIWVYSEPGRGTTFKIYLPRVDAPAEAIGRPREADSVAGTETILLAEDDPMLRPLTQALLEKLGYTVLAAANAEEALGVAGRHGGRIHLLVSDVVMPGASGRELARRLSASRPDTKTLYVSGYTDDAIVHHGMLEPGLHFLQKPFTPAALARRVREVLDAG